MRAIRGIRTIGVSIAAVLLLATVLTTNAASAAQQDVCITVDGELIYQYGTAGCRSDDGSTAVAVGYRSQANATAGGNSSVAIGNSNGGFIIGGNGNTLIVAGGSDNTVLLSGLVGCTVIYEPGAGLINTCQSGD